MSEHITAATSDYFKTVIGRHIAFAHNYVLSGFKFLPLVKIYTHERGGDWDRSLYQAESRWIFSVCADRPPGLNEALSFAPFL